MRVFWLSVLASSVACQAVPQTTSKGTYKIRTYPTGARVWMKGRLVVEATPAKLVLEAGTHQLTMAAPAGLRKTFEIEVEGGRHRDRTFRLPTPATSELWVTSLPSGASVRVNGYRRGQTPLVGIRTRPGPVDLTVTAFDGEARSVKTVLKAGQKKVIHIVFPEDGFCRSGRNERCTRNGMAKITLGLSPKGWVENAEGLRLGESPLVDFEMPIGTHQLRLVSNDGTFERWVKIEVRSDAANIYRFRLRDEDKR